MSDSKGNRKRTHIRRLREVAGNAEYITPAQLMQFFGVKYEALLKRLRGVPKFHGSYNIEDVAERIANDEVVAA